jgi:hypothetical protein
LAYSRRGAERHEDVAQAAHDARCLAISVSDIGLTMTGRCWCTSFYLNSASVAFAGTATGAEPAFDEFRDARRRRRRERGAGVIGNRHDGFEQPRCERKVADEHKLIDAGDRDVEHRPSCRAESRS